jgi:ATP-binding cassette, subfamily F, member 3
MLQIHGLRKDYGAATILSDISFTINPGEHVGLIGPNGAGKSTLLRIIVGQERPDAGSIGLPNGARIGYLAQALDTALDLTVGAAVAAAQADYTAAAHELEAAGVALATATDLDAAMARYDAALAVFEALGGYEREHRAAAMLEGLGLGHTDPDTPVAELSGGQKTRLGLATLLLREPDLVLLDEPTNHLDIEALEWLEGFVQRYPYAALIVSHDRTFLDRTVTRTLVLDPATRTIRSYVGGYSAYLAERERELAAQRAAWNDQQEYVARVRGDIARMKGQAVALDGVKTPVGDHDMKWIHSGSQAVSDKLSRAAKARERKLDRYLDADERVEKPRGHWAMKLDFGPAPASGRAVLRVEGLHFAYPEGPELFGGLELELWHGERVALVGPNGAGKSTLLKLIAGRLTPNSGTIRLGANVHLGLLVQEHEALDPARSVLDHVLRARPMRESEARTFLHLFLFGGDSVFQPAGSCSLGERSRLQLALLVVQGCNLLLLDEPLNHLDLPAREQFEAALDAFNGTVLLVSHDRTFVERFAERKLLLEG